MKKQLLIILVILILIVVVVAYYIQNAKYLDSLAQENNKQYEKYYEQEILGVDLISIINKTINNNEKNRISKKDNSIYYEDNQENSVYINIKFLENDKTFRMEEIAAQKTENFVEFFSIAKFKCSKIQYHEKTKYVKSLYFEQISY